MLIKCLQIKCDLLGSALAKLLPPLSNHGDVRTSFRGRAGEIPEGILGFNFECLKENTGTHPFVHASSNTIL